MVAADDLHGVMQGLYGVTCTAGQATEVLKKVDPA